MDVTVPQLGETVTEATVTRWLKKPGEPVTEGEPLFEVSTDKVDTEIPAVATGILGEILVPEERTVPVGTRVAVITTSSTGPPATASISEVERPPAGPALVDDAGSARRPQGSGPPRHGTLTPLVRRLLAENGLAAEQVTGTGPDGRITRHDIAAAARSRSGSSPATTAPGATEPC